MLPALLEAGENSQAGGDGRRPAEILGFERVEAGFVIVAAGGLMADQAIDLHFAGDEHAAHLRIGGVDFVRFADAAAGEMAREIG